MGLHREQELVLVLLLVSLLFDMAVPSVVAGFAGGNSYEMWMSMSAQ